MTRSLILSVILAGIFGILFSETSIAQGIVSEDNTWNVLVWEIISNDANTELLIFDGDSSVNGHDYKIMWFSYYTIGGWYMAGLLREDSNRVYFMRPDEDEGLLYDFNLDIGDSCTIVNFCSGFEVLVYVTEVDSVEYFGIKRKRMTITDNSKWVAYWIEGIGSTYGPIHSMYHKCNPPYLSWDLLCYHKNDTLLYILEGYDDCIYTHTGIDESFLDEQIILYPNPARDKFGVRSLEFEVEKVELYDMQGRKRIEKQFPPGHREVEVINIDLSSGIYLCMISVDGSKHLQKIIIQ